MSELRQTHAGPGVWALWGEEINLYLIAGQDKAVLLDSGFGFWPGLRAVAEGLCGLPVDLIHTHAHGDHTGGDGEWDEAWLHPADLADYRRDRGEEMTIHELEDGMVLELGGRSLEVIHIPGHSPGSVAFLDKANRLLFSGDTVMMQPVFLMPPNGCAADYCASLDKLMARAGEFDTVYPSHQRWPLEPMEALTALKDCALRAVRGDDSRTEFSIDLGVAVARFSGYQKDGFGVAVEALDEKTAPGGRE